MTLLGGAAVLIATLQSRGRATFLGVLLPAAALEPALILGFHRSLLQVVQVVDLSMLLLVAALSVLILLEQPRSTAVEAPIAASPVLEPRLAEVSRR